MDLKAKVRNTIFESIRLGNIEVRDFKNSTVLDFVVSTTFIETVENNRFSRLRAEYFFINGSFRNNIVQSLELLSWNPLPNTEYEASIFFGFQFLQYQCEPVFQRIPRHNMPI